MTGIDEPAAAEAVGTVLVEPEGSTGVEGESEKLASGPGRADAGNGGDSPRTFNKQRRGVLAMAGVALALGAVGCGVSEEQFNAASSEAENLKSENRKRERENGRLKKELAAGSVAEEHDPEPVGTHPRAVPRSNVTASFNPEIDTPQISASAYVDEKASVIGRVILSDGVYVAPSASVRGDEGEPIFVGAGSNIQDGVVLHGLETFESDQGDIEKNQVEANGKKYSVYVGSDTSLAHQCHLHGPAKVGDKTFIGMQALVFKATVGNGCVIEPAAKLIGVTVADGRYVPAGMILTSQEDADNLPVITPDYGFATINAGVIHVNHQLATGYGGGGGEAGGHE